MRKIIRYELYQNRYKEFFVTALKNNQNHICEQNEKIIFVVRLTGESEAVIYKELTAVDYDTALQKYKVVLSSDDTDIDPGRYHYDCILLDKNEEKHRIESGRIIVHESYV